jgi:hypothetical protein
VQPRVVRPEWVTASVAAGRLLPEAPFLAVRDPAARTIGEALAGPRAAGP